MPLQHATPERDRQPRTAAVAGRGVNPQIERPDRAVDLR